MFGIVIYRGFCLGYTISACVCTMGITKGIFFIIITSFLQNLLFIPAIIALAVSGFKFYKSIVKEKERRKENIKMELIRHTIFSTLMLGLLGVASLIEIFLSTNIFKILVKYF